MLLGCQAAAAVRGLCIGCGAVSTTWPRGRARPLLLPVLAAHLPLLSPLLHRRLPTLSWLLFRPALQLRQGGGGSEGGCGQRPGPLGWVTCPF